LVVLHVELNLQGNLVGQLRDGSGLTSLKDDVVAGGEFVCDRTEAR
jgi:hypothetical protein